MICNKIIQESVNPTQNTGERMSQTEMTANTLISDAQWRRVFSAIPLARKA